jgi:hypothetical protein
MRGASFEKDTAKMTSRQASENAIDRQPERHRTGEFRLWAGL